MAIPNELPSANELEISILPNGVWVHHFIPPLTFILRINDCEFQGHKHVEENQGVGGGERMVLSHSHYYTPNSMVMV